MNSRFTSAVVASLFISSCTPPAPPPPAKCGAIECAPICATAKPIDKAPAAIPGTPAKPIDETPPTPTTGMTEFERTLADPMLEDIRAGVRPWGDEAVGLCKGQGKECDGFIGLEAPDLADGEYMLRAELRVPRTGGEDTWKVKLDTECTVTTKTESGESTNTRSRSNEYTVRWVGEDRGYRLSPLHKITSPSPGGAEACTWTLTALHPDTPATYEGRWSVPGAK